MESDQGKLRRLFEAVKRLLAGDDDEQDRRHLREGLLTGKMILASGDAAVAVGGDLRDSTVVTGDHNTIYRITVAGADYQRFQERPFPAPRGLVPPLPNLIFLGRAEALAEVKQRIGVGPGAAPANRLAIMHGLPGVGKTTLVSILAHDP
jgi:hypothetical protein